MGPTRHHGHQAGFVDGGEVVQVSDSQNGLHVGIGAR